MLSIGGLLILCAALGFQVITAQLQERNERRALQRRAFDAKLEYGRVRAVLEDMVTVASQGDFDAGESPDTAPYRRERVSSPVAKMNVFVFKCNDMAILFAQESADFEPKHRELVDVLDSTLRNLLDRIAACEAAGCKLPPETMSLPQQSGCDDHLMRYAMAVGDLEDSVSNSEVLLIWDPSKKKPVYIGAGRLTFIERRFQNSRSKTQKYSLEDWIIPSE